MKEKGGIAGNSSDPSTLEGIRNVRFFGGGQPKIVDKALLGIRKGHSGPENDQKGGRRGLPRSGTQFGLFRKKDNKRP